MEDTPISDDMVSSSARDKSLVANQALVYVLIKFVKKLLATEKIDARRKKYWECFLEDNGFSDVDNFDRFREIRKTTSKILKPELKIVGTGGSVGSTEWRIEKEARKVNDCINDLWSNFLECFPNDKCYMIYLDDIDTRIDLKSDPDNEALTRLLEKVRKFNGDSMEKEKNVKIIVCIRSDIWNYLQGFNLSKSQSLSLKIDWKESDFFGLMARRIEPKRFFEGKDAVQVVERMFPDNLYTNRANKIADKQFHTHFYQYIYTLSFNRARDFLQYGWIAQKKVPGSGKLTETQIEPIEREFCAYMRGQLSNELLLYCQTANVNYKDIDSLLRNFSSKSFDYKGFKNACKLYKLKQSITPYELLKELWSYSIIGVSRNGIITFRYYDFDVDLPEENSLQNNHDFKLCLHRGLQIAYQTRMV